MSDEEGKSKGCRDDCGYDPRQFRFRAWTGGLLAWDQVELPHKRLSLFKMGQVEVRFCPAHIAQSLHIQFQDSHREWDELIEAISK